jgi:hypothetical protein
MRLSLEKGAHAVLSSAACRNPGSFALFAKGGIRDGRYRDPCASSLPSAHHLHFAGAALDERAE